MTPERAETIALLALGWLAGHDDLAPDFLGSSGAGAEDLRTRATDPQFLVSVLDFITMDDAWVVAFCDASDLAYDQPLAARYALPGAEQVHWT
jgi:hypothetical protein